MNFVKNIDNRDKELFFGPLDNESFIEIEDHWIMAHILHESGIFPSVSQARKNGWDKDIPFGFTILTVGKKRKQIFIFNNADCNRCKDKSMCYM